MIQFVKMHGIMNDYVYVDCVSKPGLAKRDWTKLAPMMSDRHAGVGGDGVILVCEPSKAGGAPGGGKAQGAMVRMRMFNSDGSESEMCGNGIRCVAKFAKDVLGIAGPNVMIETGTKKRMVREVKLITKNGRVVGAKVRMGRPEFGLAAVGGLSAKRVGAKLQSVLSQVVKWRDERGKSFSAEMFFVSMGNPHAVVFVDSLEQAELFVREHGRAIETHKMFGGGINVHAACMGGRTSSGSSARKITMRTWERGTGYTMACGTGACAVVVAGVMAGRNGPKAKVDLPGGQLEIQWERLKNTAGGEVIMTGPATEVFRGSWIEPGDHELG